MNIRQENIKDYQEVYNVIKLAFETSTNKDGNEQDLVVELRKSNNFIKELSLVAIIDDNIVGYILFTKINIGEYEELALAPLAVLPQYQKQGIGGALIKEGHRIAKKLGYHYSVVLGSEKYYPQYGYVKATTYGIKPPFKIPTENFMAIKLNKTNKKIQGTVKYAKEFNL